MMFHTVEQRQKINRKMGSHLARCLDGVGPVPGFDLAPDPLALATF
jgi:hypothetical protein